MNEIIKNMIERHSIRKYKTEQVDETTLQQILEAGLYAPSAGSRQSAMIGVCHNPALIKVLGKYNAASFKGRVSTSTAYISNDHPSIADDPSIGDGFYGAPVLLTLFGPRNFLYSEADCCVMAQNIMLAAHSLGVGSCFVARARETFSGEEGQKLLRDWDIPTNYAAMVHITLGYSSSETAPKAKSRKEGRVRVSPE
ncbi:nitroreductase family protein [Desulfosporosinus fructosivorans]|uniref:Nitroreductase family protein n=1 Tax=Desulfosporosinus fructosivorans TaxID=2018669 RepID=A0A4Z0RA98_9FIRM|nr:nitroreductase family protein [Desulfosporosinus fructosivorans]TGE39364.1 nitroreductase family protein [Desulfosporosinus fructosivorans]